jgi:hypothetical protein
MGIPRIDYFDLGGGGVAGESKRTEGGLGGSLIVAEFLSGKPVSRGAYLAV